MKSFKIQWYILKVFDSGLSTTMDLVSSTRLPNAESSTMNTNSDRTRG